MLIADLALRPEAQQLVNKYSHPSAIATSTATSSPSSPHALFVETDVTSWPALSHAFTTAIATFGGLDLVCPAAGVFEPHWSNFWHPPGSAASRDPASGGRYATLDINLAHPIRATQLALVEFLNPARAAEGERRAGPQNPKRVVHVSSIAAQAAAFPVPLYTASKAALSGFVRSLGLLDGAVGVRVCAVAPGVVRTPLWTEHAEKMHMVDEGADEWVEPGEVAEAMVRCAEDGDLPGGTVLEVGKGTTRRVEILNDPGPSGAGVTASGVGSAVSEVFAWLGMEPWSGQPVGEVPAGQEVQQEAPRE